MNKDIREITILGGYNKFNEKEEVQIKLSKGEVISIVGNTGSGKSRLLADIECIAQEDTPTKRKILLDGREPSKHERYAIDNKLVAEISQNMNFVMDLTVEDFVLMHAETRVIYEDINKVEEVIECANNLAGERFKKRTPLTQLSGGQSRALMIADVAFLSSSPIVLIDEIENAGVDRKKALDLLVEKDKLILMSTHDPILALMGSKRIVIENGGIKKVIETTKKERENLEFLLDIDKKFSSLRDKVRSGDMLDINIKNYFKEVY